jgi:hypothetical protein
MLDAHLVGGSLDRVAQADFFFGEESWKPHAVRLVWPALVRPSPVFLLPAAIFAFLFHASTFQVLIELRV